MSLKIKDEARERDGYKCVDCGMSREDHVGTYGRNLDVHRLLPGSEYTIDGCVTVCFKCHRARHKVLPRAPRGQGRDFARDIRLVRIREKFAKQLTELAKRNETNFTQEVNRAVREFLESQKLWPLNDQQANSLEVRP